MASALDHVVQKLVKVNSRLNINQSIFSCVKSVFVAHVSGNLVTWNMCNKDLLGITRTENRRTKSIYGQPYQKDTKLKSKYLLIFG